MMSEERQGTRGFYDVIDPHREIRHRVDWSYVAFWSAVVVLFLLIIGR